MAQVFLGMSGGVDSSVAAVLLQRAGYEVVGVTCLFHDDEASRGDAAAAEEVCLTAQCCAACSMFRKGIHHSQIKHPLCPLRERHRGCLFVSDDLTLCGERA